MLEGLRDARSAESPSWQQLDPVCQLEQLPSMWKGPSEALSGAAQELLSALSDGSLPPEVAVALVPACDQLGSELAKMKT